MNFGRFTAQWEICTTMFDAHMEQALFSLVFFQSQNVILLPLYERMVNILAADKAHSSDPIFRRFRRQLFHLSLSKIFETLWPGMEIPEVALCPDGYL